MEHYEKGEVKEIHIPGLVLDDNVVTMKVSYGTKIRNVMGYAMKKFKEPGVKQITWNGRGNAITKAISCAEIMKRKIKSLHQITKVRYSRVEEYWEPKKEGLERLRVNRDIPAITILLSKEPLDSSEPGYQAPGVCDAFWKNGKDEKKGKGEKRRNKKSDPVTAQDSSGLTPSSGTSKRKKKGETGAKSPAKGGKGKNIRDSKASAKGGNDDETGRSSVGGRKALDDIVTSVTGGKKASADIKSEDTSERQPGSSNEKEMDTS